MYEAMYRDDRIEVMMELNRIGLGHVVECRERLEVLPVETDELGARGVEIEFVDGENVVDVPIRSEIVPRHLVVELKFEPFLQNLFRTPDEGLVGRVDTSQHTVDLGPYDLLETETEVHLSPLFDSFETSGIADGFFLHDDSILLFDSSTLPLLLANLFYVFGFPLRVI